MKKMIAFLFILNALVFTQHYAVKAQITLQTVKNATVNTEPQKLLVISDAGEIKLNDWFLQQTEELLESTTINEWSGPWAVATDADNLYLGLSNDRPAGPGFATVSRINVDGNPVGEKLLIDSLPVVDRTQLLPVEQDYLDENGIHMLDWTDTSKEKLIIPGTDPGIHDGWNGGNVYWFDKNVDQNGLTKVRCQLGQHMGECADDSEVFPNIVHFFGSTQIGDRYFLGGSTPVGNTSKPEIWGSTNAGKSWERLYTFPNTTYFRSKQLFALKDPQNIDKYQLYSITQYNNPDSQLANKIFYSNERTVALGNQWNSLNIDAFAAPHTNIAPLTINEETGYYVDYRGENIVKLNNDNTLMFIPFTGFKVGYKYHQGPEANYLKYHALTTDSTYLYVVADNNGIYRYDISQATGSTWELVHMFPESTTEKPYLIHYWSEKQGLVIGTIGTDASLYFMGVE